MTAHKHADFLRAIADGESIRSFEVKHHTSSLWRCAGVSDTYELLSLPNNYESRRKPKTSRERFEKWFDAVRWPSDVSSVAWSAWQEAERQALEARDD